jgi:hypothetical protein
MNREMLCLQVGRYYKRNQTTFGEDSEPHKSPTALQVKMDPEL